MASAFKYYIHDTAEGYIFELHGPMTHACVREINLCWQTAKPTLYARNVIMDLRGVTSLDEETRQWLASMREDGASYHPETFLLDSVAGLDHPYVPVKPLSKQSIFGRLFGLSAKPAP